MPREMGWLGWRVMAAVWLRSTRFYLGTVVRDGTGAVIGNTFRDREYEDRAFGLSICENCLHGVCLLARPRCAHAARLDYLTAGCVCQIPGGRGEMEESCNATFYSGENLFTGPSPTVECMGRGAIAFC